MAGSVDKEWQASVQVSSAYSLQRLEEGNVVAEKLANCCSRSFHNMIYTIPKYMGMIMKHSNLLDPSFFEDRESKALGVVVRTVKPIIKFENDQVELKYNVGTRGNGKDAPRWPEDLMTEVVQ